MKMKRKKKRSGSSSRWLAVLILIAASLSSPLEAGKKKDPKQPEAYSVVAGTVFREPGFALPGAEVTISSIEDEAAGKKARKMTFTANTRGEFAFHVPSVKAAYNVSVAIKGFIGQQKKVEVSPDERVDVTFVLVPESK